MLFLLGGKLCEKTRTIQLTFTFRLSITSETHIRHVPFLYLEFPMRQVAVDVDDNGLLLFKELQ